MYEFYQRREKEVWLATNDERERERERERVLMQWGFWVSYTRYYYIAVELVHVCITSSTDWVNGWMD